MSLDNRSPRKPRRVWKILGIILVVLVFLAALGFVSLSVSASQAGVSVPAQLLRAVMLPAIPMPTFSTPEELQAQIDQNRAQGPALPSDALRAKFSVQETEVDGSSVWTVVPQSDAGPLQILYLPGGAYVNEALPLHWEIVEQLVDRTGATLTMPFYPLAPENDYQPAYALVRNVYDHLVATAGAENVVVMGDSAGGGIALSLVQQLRDQGQPLPAALVLFSPWLDLTLSDPAQPVIAERDHILQMPMLRIAGEWWAGDLALADPRVSPLYGDLAGLPPIAVFTGTDDLLNPDSTRLHANAEAAGVPVTLYEYPNMFHVWMGVMPQMLPEARQALDEAAAFIQEQTSGR